jgi:hypothetical protein
LNSLGIRLGEKPQVFLCDLYVRPETFIEHLRNSHELRFPVSEDVLHNTHSAFVLLIRKACAAYQTILGRRHAAQHRWATVQKFHIGVLGVSSEFPQKEFGVLDGPPLNV